MIPLATAIIALIAAILGLYKTYQQGLTLQQQVKTVQQQQQEIEKLRGLASRIALDITIERPKEGELLPPIYDEMGGSFSGTIPFDHQLWVLAKDRSNYFLMYPTTQVAYAARHWSQTNIRLATQGNWQLALCLANKGASTWLQERVNKQEWSGFAELPQGIEIVRYIDVKSKGVQP